MKATPLALLAVCTFLAPRLAAAQDLQPPPPMTEPQPQQPQPQPQAQQPTQPQAAPAQQQGLAPPPPMPQQTPAPQSTERSLDEAKQKDSGRGLEFFYLNAQGGVAYDALGAISDNLKIGSTSAAGGMIGAEAGVRFVWFTAGMRFRYEMLQPFNLWQLDAVLGFRVPAGKWDIAATLHGGYAAIGSLDPNDLGGSANQILPCTGAGCTTQDAANALTTKGASVGLAIGADYYLFPAFSIGFEAAFELLFLHRDPLPLPQACAADPTCTAAAQAQPLYQSSGDAAGVGLIASAHVALHL